MSREQFEKEYAEDHDMPIETFSQYRMGDSYRLPMIAKCWRFYQKGMPQIDREAIRDAVAQALGDTYDCTRVWSAWGVGTMSEDDFYPVAESEERLYEIVDAALMAAGFEVKS